MGFDKTILISFTSQKQTNVMSRLDQGNGYQVVQEIPAGTYQIGFINIVGGNVTDYNIDVMDTFEIIEGKETQLSLKLALKSNSQSQGTSKEIALPVSDTKAAAAVNLEPSGNSNRSNGPVDSIALPENPTMTNKPTAAAKVSLSETQVNIIISLAILVLIVLLCTDKFPINMIIMTVEYGRATTWKMSNYKSYWHVKIFYLKRRKRSMRS